ncbi:Predicted O-methyltransferase [alpha proteobacterium BAL199]|nr:Predicted O-methyltransferase [alpha proteobacterium BAL199]
MSGSTSAEPAITDDTLLDGRVRFLQPRDGYRVAVDPVLLAASVPVRAEQRVLDLGCGAGAVFLCLLARFPQLSVVAVERDPTMAGLARDNVARNGVAERATVVTADLSALPASWEMAAFDQVVTNPPFLPANRADPSPQPGRASAGVEATADLGVWIDRAHRCLKPKGRISVIHRVDRLDDLLAALAGRFGGIVVFPLWPKAGRDAKRLIVTARKGVRSPLRLSAGLVLHDEAGGYTKEADAVLRGAGLDLVG